MLTCIKEQGSPAFASRDVWQRVNTFSLPQSNMHTSMMKILQCWHLLTRELLSITSILPQLETIAVALKCDARRCTNREKKGEMKSPNKPGYIKYIHTKGTCTQIAKYLGNTKAPLLYMLDCLLPEGFRHEKCNMQFLKDTTIGWRAPSCFEAMYLSQPWTKDDRLKGKFRRNEKEPHK